MLPFGLQVERDEWQRKADEDGFAESVEVRLLGEALGCFLRFLRDMKPLP